METIVYRINCPSSHQKLLHFEASFPAEQESIHLHISAWRPGRYELANFAKNIKCLSLFNVKYAIIGFVSKKNILMIFL